MPWRAYDSLGLGAAAGAMRCSEAWCWPGIVEPARKLDSLRALEEAGAAAPLPDHLLPAQS